MGILEILLVSAGISFDVLAVAVCYGAVLMTIDKKKLMYMTLIFCGFQVGATALGSVCRVFPIFSERGGYSQNMYNFCSIVILLALGLFLLYKGWRNNDMLERRSEMNFRRITLTAAFASIDSFFAGLGFAFMDANLIYVFVCLFVVTAAAVVGGLYIGYHLGYEPKKNAYYIGSAVLLCAAIDVFIRLFV